MKGPKTPKNHEKSLAVAILRPDTKFPFCPRHPFRTRDSIVRIATTPNHAQARDYSLLSKFNTSLISATAIKTRIYCRSDPRINVQYTTRRAFERSNVQHNHVVGDLNSTLILSNRDFLLCHLNVTARLSWMAFPFTRKYNIWTGIAFEFYAVLCDRISYQAADSLLLSPPTQLLTIVTMSILAQTA